MFQPVVPLSGIGGYRFLERTEETQREAFARSPLLQRDLDYFRENIASATTAEALVSDRRLLQVALGAFGLDDDLNKQAFVRKVLEEGTDADDAFANRLVESSYRKIADAFGYGNFLGARVGRIGFAEDITAAYEERQFEIALDNSNPDMRLALNFRREITEFAQIAAEGSGDSAWFSLMGREPVRRVMESALGLPASFGSLDIDRQLSEFKAKAASVLGSSDLSTLLDPEKVDETIRRFLARSQAENGPDASTPGFAALSLLNGGLGSSAIQNLLLSSALR